MLSFSKILRAGCLLIFVLNMMLLAQTKAAAPSTWTFTTRMTMTGLSESSEPEGYKAYSSLGFNAGLRKSFCQHISTEFILAKESREIDFIDSEQRETSLGSLDYLQFVLLAQYHFKLAEKMRTYIGVGGNYNRYFEKSGTINPYRVPDSFGLTGQLGFDFQIAPNMIANVDFRTNQMQAEISSSKHRITKLDINPLAISLGLGFQF